jgi:hypothetical protein
MGSIFRLTEWILCKMKNLWWRILTLWSGINFQVFTLQKAWDLNGHPLLCMFSADDFRWYSVFSASYRALNKVIFWWQRFNVCEL